MDGVERILVLGLGNTLLGDDGVGIRALELLRAHYHFPARVRLVDGGTRGLALLPLLQRSSSLLILDAVTSSELPGTLVRLVGPELEPVRGPSPSMHESGLTDLLAAAALLDTLPSRIVLLGLVPGRVRCGDGLSHPVAQKLDDLAAAAAAELRSWGCWIRNSPGPASRARRDRQAPGCGG